VCTRTGWRWESSVNWIKTNKLYKINDFGTFKTIVMCYVVESIHYSVHARALHPMYRAHVKGLDPIHCNVQCFFQANCPIVSLTHLYF